MECAVFSTSIIAVIWSLAIQLLIIHAIICLMNTIKLNGKPPLHTALPKESCCPGGTRTHDLVAQARSRTVLLRGECYEDTSQKNSTRMSLATEKNVILRTYSYNVIRAKVY